MCGVARYFSFVSLTDNHRNKMVFARNISYTIKGRVRDELRIVAIITILDIILLLMLIPEHADRIRE